MKKLITFIFLTLSISVGAQNIKTETVKRDIERSQKLYSPEYKQILIADRNGIKVKTEKIRNNAYTYEIKRNGVVIEKGTVEVRNGKTYKVDGKKATLIKKK